MENINCCKTTTKGRHSSRPEENGIVLRVWLSQGFHVGGAEPLKIGSDSISMDSFRERKVVQVKGKWEQLEKKPV